MNRDWKFIGLILFFFAVLCVTYSNHFTNGFQFDDVHTIVDNEYIRDIKNIPKFFTEAETRSTLPTNRAYRPMVATLNAIDYHLAGGLKPVYFHASMFLWYIIQIFLLFFIFRKIINLSQPHKWNNYFALFITAFYAMHTGNAETMNYILARSDLFSTMLIVASLALYIHPKTRRFHLYLVTLVLSQLTKQTGLMFFPILFAYIMIFEEKLTLAELITFRRPAQVKRLFAKVAPAAIISIGTFLLTQMVLTTSGDFLGAQASSRWHYFITQQHVIMRYIGNFFIPINLSPDQTVILIRQFLDHRVVYGFMVHIGLIITAVVMMGKPKYKPVSFGIFWFYFALFPTSSFHAFAQISNDHRIFFPYIGAALAVGWLVVILFKRYEASLVQKQFRVAGFAILSTLLILSYAYGTYQRNQVWSSSETLWLDAATKGPNNGRALMNYGLTKMSKGEYKEAAEYFDKTEKLLPHWAYIHINQGILKNATGDPETAEEHFKKAIRFQGFNPEGYYHYARFLYGKGRTDEAKIQLNKALEKSPGHSKSREYLAYIDARGDRKSSIEEMLEMEPSVGNYLNLSLAYYKSKEFEKSIEMAHKALDMNPRSAQAYNNICAANCGLKRWEDAVAACGKSLEIDPDFQRAKNNLNWALGEIKKAQESE